MGDLYGESAGRWALVFGVGLLAVFLVYLAWHTPEGRAVADAAWRAASAGAEGGARWAGHRLP